MHRPIIGEQEGAGPGHTVHILLWVASGLALQVAGDLGPLHMGIDVFWLVKVNLLMHLLDELYICLQSKVSGLVR